MYIYLRSRIPSGIAKCVIGLRQTRHLFFEGYNSNWHFDPGEHTPMMCKSQNTVQTFGQRSAVSGRQGDRIPV